MRSPAIVFLLFVIANSAFAAPAQWKVDIKLNVPEEGSKTASLEMAKKKCICENGGKKKNISLKTCEEFAKAHKKVFALKEAPLAAPPSSHERSFLVSFKQKGATETSWEQNRSALPPPKSQNDFIYDFIIAGLDACVK